MFGNLKNKLGDVADLKKYGTPQNLVNSLMGSRQTSGSRTPIVASVATSPRTLASESSSCSEFVQVNNQLTITSNQSNNSEANHVNQLSTSSESLSIQSNSSICLNSSNSSANATSHSLAHSPLPSVSCDSPSPPLSPGLSPTPHVEQQEAACNTYVKEKALQENEVQKLRLALEQQQDTHLARIAAKDAEWRNKFAKHADQASHYAEEVQRREDTITSLRRQLDVSNDQIEGLVQRLQSVQDNCDELEGLSVQEASKIKHMLLNTSTELEDSRSQLKQRIAAQDELQHQLGALEEERCSQVQQLQEKVHNLQQEVLQLEQCRQQQLRSTAATEGNNDGRGRLQELQQQHADREQLLLEKVSEWHSECTRQAVLLSQEQQARGCEQSAHAAHMLQCATELQSQRDQYAALQDTLHLCTEKSNSDSHMEKERSRTDIMEERKKSLQQQLIIKEECEEKENEFLATIAQITSSREDDILKHAENLQTERHIIEQLKQQLVAEEAASAASGQQAAATTTRCDRLQELQGRTDDQMKAEKANSEGLQTALTAARLQKQLLEGSKAELEAKIHAYSSEKSKLSAHLDEYASKVAVLQQQLQEQVMVTALLQEQHQQLQEHARQYKQKISCYESGAQAEQLVERSSRYEEQRLLLAQLQEEVADKTQALKIQGQRIADMKKTMQRELRITSDPLSDQSTAWHSVSITTDDSLTYNTSPAVLPLSSNSRITEFPAITKDYLMDPINLEYLKHVVLKFLTSKEYEARHLTKAMGALLHLTREEERLLHDTLTWRMSWFGTKPSGQKAFSTPPSS